MKGRLTLQQRLILPVILLGLITLLSNILAVFSIKVHLIRHCAELSAIVIMKC